MLSGPIQCTLCHVAVCNSAHTLSVWCRGVCVCSWNAVWTITVHIVSCCGVQWCTYAQCVVPWCVCAFLKCCLYQYSAHCVMLRCAMVHIRSVCGAEVCSVCRPFPQFFTSSVLQIIHASTIRLRPLSLRAFKVVWKLERHVHTWAHVRTPLCVHVFEHAPFFEALTCSFPSFVCARCMKMSKMRAVRSHT